MIYVVYVNPRCENMEKFSMKKKKKEQQARRKRKSIETRRADNIEILNCK